MPNLKTIVACADETVAKYGTRDPAVLAKEMGVEVYYCDFSKQRGAYKVILRNRFAFINGNLDDISKRIVLLHELGHDVLHRREAVKVGGFSEFNLFAAKENRLEYEANAFAAQIELPDDEFLACCEKGYDINQIAMAMNSDANLVAIKADILISQGHNLRAQEHRDDFLKYDK